MERLQVSPGSPYSALEASIHLARYAPVLPLCEGRRVLDLACGEGYGSWLMAQAGAVVVDGVDVSRDAVAAAAATFQLENLRFLTADGQAALRDGEATAYDLIVCIETIEHVADPERMLRQLRSLMAPGCIVCITCPNDHWYYPQYASNPFHLRKYRFSEFRRLTEATLGPASRWLLGTAALGFTTLPVDATALPGGPSVYVEAEPLASALLCGPDGADVVTPANASYFMGLWNTDGLAVTGGAFFPMSMTRYAQKEDALTQVVALRAAAEASSAAEATAVSAQLAQLRQLIQAEREEASEMAALRGRLTETEREIASLQANLIEKEREITRGREGLSVVRSEREAVVSAAQAVRIQAAALRAENDVLGQSVARLSAEVQALTQRAVAAEDIAAAASRAAEQNAADGAIRQVAITAAHRIQAESAAERLAIAEACLAAIRQFVARRRSLATLNARTPIKRMLAAYEADCTRLVPWPPSQADVGVRQRLIEASGLLDRDAYNAANPDVLAAAFEPVLHYLLHGDGQRRPMGSRFEASAYLLANPDVAEANENALIHFILHGAQEARPLRPHGNPEPSH
ncbi:class I SAM-dependent methyltransferase [Methylobacterium haplocladii]|uniref:Methyltransferase domain-containing protein n=1 Tax=Methylobacterium haplocladii TaxID=1176176 RepID=A0A512IVN7_9HYPH|nr:methyltransferase domain-containing protein [Methylobacterium haplocladii]GEP01784.1 hypothetical protein MHA02_41710 [Methylobacterium haplocladii]GJD86284.1 Ubiquinone biosynthesis O-methyltransferase, mitochondrial [Methylobacterium haplocladii]GLS60455.1 hypothetical protein GCM10007887_31340 [Methylobacterium haplocladii]